jgi:SAM-dependent methyltransferase
MNQQLMKRDPRTPEQITEHYEIEKELAHRLRNASTKERRYLYSALYDELFRRVPLHPLLTRKSSPSERTETICAQMKFLELFLNNNATFLEVGPGDCALSFEVAKSVKQVYAVDVSDEITKALTTPDNFQLLISDGCSIPVPRNSVNVAYSDQLMEHLHPEDAFEQLQNIYNTLVPGGTYICITPNKLTGPHDVSKYFDEIATGFHLKEYTISELTRLFREAGFSRVTIFIGARGIFTRVPPLPLILCEKLLCKLPYAFRKSLTDSRPVRVLLDVILVGIK